MIHYKITYMRDGEENVESVFAQNEEELINILAQYFPQGMKS